jgi:nucleotide-binding universal stress UspA family protein
LAHALLFWRASNKAHRNGGFKRKERRPMHVQKIMCPIDFTDSSMAALDDAASLARQLDAQLLILHVEERLPAPTADFPDLPFHSGDWRRLVERTSPQLNGVNYERHVAHGEPREEIPRFAQSHEVDLVVMAHHTSQERAQCRGDGVCDSTSRECKCPVMTVKHTVGHPPWVRVDGDGWSPL